MVSVLTITEAKESVKILVKKIYFYHMASVLVDPRQKRNHVTPVNLEPRHKRDFMASANNRCQMASSQYASVPDPRQNEENNRDKKPLLHWCKTDSTQFKTGSTWLEPNPMLSYMVLLDVRFHNLKIISLNLN